jgi:hypothetical protein
MAMRPLVDVTIDVKHKLAALWIAMLFLYAYGDIFGYFRPGFIDEVRAGRVAAFQINQLYLAAVAVYIALPSLMVFLSLALRPPTNRWANIVLSAVYIVTILASCIGETWAYYFILSIAECALLLLIIWQAWRWPRAAAPVAGNGVSTTTRRQP